MVEKTHIVEAFERLQLEFPAFEASPERAREWLREFAKVPPEVLSEAVSRVNRSENIRVPRLADVSGFCYRILARKLGQVTTLAEAEAEAIQVSRGGDGWRQASADRGPVFARAYEAASFHRYGQLTDDYGRGRLIAAFRDAFKAALTEYRSENGLPDLPPDA